MDANNNSLLAIISALTALAAVFVGPIVALKVSNKTTISPMRQAWINNLRDSIAKFLATTEKSEFKKYILDENEDKEIKNAKKMARQKIYETLFHIESKIKLMINPDEPNHITLLKAIEEMTKWTSAEELSSEELEKLEPNELTNFQKKQQKIIDISRTILKEEWDVVKYG